ncbi:MAG: hypothetical protein GEV28_21770 [Actinophytocola sp.]|uniref:hypothetical protein n=1 Tax=Actinophytocola sp. TaxID=1872138 RepID=UPI001328AEF6|nr:hypothetical protein [Actinophytocola sp.]MPZ82882.1 hypothetical protein [Actinophytocola sp.]
MTRPGAYDDDHLPDRFLVDGVAPSVIGETDGPDPAGDGGYDGGYDGGGYEYEARTYREPPTSPIPAQKPPEERRSWLGRMFGR